MGRNIRFSLRHQKTGFAGFLVSHIFLCYTYYIMHPQITRTVAVALILLLAVTTFILLYAYTEQGKKINEYEHSLDVQGQKLSYTIGRLQDRESNMTLISYTEPSEKDVAEQPKDAYQTYGTVDVGNERYYEVVDRRMFSYKGKDGYVMQGCAMGGAVVTKFSEVVCLSENIIFFVWNDESIELDVFTTPTLASVKQIGDVAFTEGMYETVTESTKENTRLLVIMNNSGECIMGDLCIPWRNAAYEIQFPDVTHKKTVYSIEEKTNEYMRLMSMHSLAWNAEGNRALYLVPCAEGCPDVYLQGLNLDTQSMVTLETGRYAAEFEGGDMLRTDVLNWIDEDTVMVDGKEYTF
jgi:hypothetical protein